LTRWLDKGAIHAGPIFRSIDRWGGVGDKALTPDAINHIIKRRCRLAGLDPSEYSAHGLRSGYMTEAGRRGIPLLEAMQQSRHKTIQQASVYYNEANRTKSHAVRMMD
jgi:integrase